mgnify:CR=1 FL=1
MNRARSGNEVPARPATSTTRSSLRAGSRSETTAHELAEYDVRCSVVCPSYFRTNLMHSLRGADEDLGAIVAGLVANSPISADDIAAAVLEGLDRGDEVIVPDRPAREAYGLKLHDRPAYDAVMRAQAAKLEKGI